MRIGWSACRAVLVMTMAAIWAAADSRVAAQNVRLDTAWVASSDGVHLRTFVYRPATEGPYPVVVVRSPYTGERGSGMAWLAERLVPRGYAVVEQDVRGTGGSTGAFVPFVHDAADGRATLDWVVAQRWAGKVGLWGVSYPGWAAYASASTGHNAVAAMVVGSSYGDLGGFLSPGGAFHLMAHVPWMMGFGPEGQGRLPPKSAFEQIFRTTPLTALLGGQTAVAEYAERAFDWDAIDIPTLHWTGWHDYIYTHALKGYDELRRADKRHRAEQRLIIGPWAHGDELSGVTRIGDMEFGPAATADVDSIVNWSLAFFDEYLRDMRREGDAARVFVLGENRWRTFDAWPPAVAQPMTWYVDADGVLTGSPAAAAGTLQFRYDPNDPLPTVGGVGSHFFRENLGPLAQNALDARDDVLRLVSAPLESDLVLAGPIRAVLRITTDAPSTDVTAKLVAVAPDGTATILEDGIRREASLSGVRDVVVELGQRAQRLPRGTRLRLDVSGGNFPKYARNPNTGEDPFAATTFVPVRITLHTGGTAGSRLVLTVLPE